jgi:hypothetical protein
MVIFNSYVNVYQRVFHVISQEKHKKRDSYGGFLNGWGSHFLSHVISGF